MNKQELACKICQLELPKNFHVISSDFWRVRHSFETNILGYCILESRRHFLDLSEADGPELLEYGILLAAIMKVQRDVLHCKRVYTFSLAEAVPHFHVHVIPRRKDFVRAYKGRGITQYPTKPAADLHLVENVVQTLQIHLRRSLSKLPDITNPFIM